MPLVPHATYPRAPSMHLQIMGLILAYIALTCIILFAHALVSLLAPGSSWMDWSHMWGGEMCLRKALVKLNLEYLHDSDD
jgi:hypothetical protein